MRKCSRKMLPEKEVPRRLKKREEPAIELSEESPLVVPKVIRQYTRKKKESQSEPVANNFITDSTGALAAVSAYFLPGFSKVKVDNDVKLKEKKVKEIREFNLDITPDRKEGLVFKINPKNADNNLDQNRQSEMDIVEIKNESISDVKVTNCDNNSEQNTYGNVASIAKVDSGKITKKSCSEVKFTRLHFNSEQNCSCSTVSNIKIKKRNIPKTVATNTNIKSNQNSLCTKLANPVKIIRKLYILGPVSNSSNPDQNTSHATVINEANVSKIKVSDSDINSECKSSYCKGMNVKLKEENTERRLMNTGYDSSDSYINESVQHSSSIKVEPSDLHDVNLDIIDDKNNVFGCHSAIPDAKRTEESKHTITRVKDEKNVTSIEKKNSGENIKLGMNDSSKTRMGWDHQVCLQNEYAYLLQNKPVVTEEVDIKKEEIESDTDMDGQFVSVTNDIKNEPASCDANPGIELSEHISDISNVSITKQNVDSGDRKKINNIDRIGLKKVRLVAVNVAPGKSMVHRTRRRPGRQLSHGRTVALLAANPQKVGIPATLPSFKLVAKSQLYTCDLCGENLLYKMEMRLHMRTAHSAAVRYWCALCPARFRYHYLLLTHLRVHFGKPFTCDLCPKHFKSSKTYASHLNSHMRERLFSCPVCLRRFTQLDFLHRHATRHSSADAFPCDACDTKFGCAIDLNRHSESVHGKKCYYPCYVCSHAFWSDSDLIAHLKKHDNAIYHCGFCIKRFVDFRKWEAHSSEHIRKMGSNKPFENAPHGCHVCNKHFKYKSILKTHLRCHTGERPYSCSVCSKRFKTRSAATEHEKGHARPFPCAECGARFARRDTLSRHQLLHSGERPHACPSCARSFVQRSALQLHVRRHHTPGLKIILKKKKANKTARKTRIPRVSGLTDDHLIQVK